MNVIHFSVELTKEQLVFSAAHFITFGDEICEALHGHNYGVRCEVHGPLNAQGYVVDFIALRDALAAIVKRLDHRVLLPLQHPRIEVSESGGEVTARYGERRWVFPAGDCKLLPVANTTAELLARWIGETLLTEAAAALDGVTRLRIGVDENHGQWGWCDLVT
jgi:6-pyruvoyltetrahydropterin/6-carboxytetrahydropterin synthase